MDKQIWATALATVAAFASAWAAIESASAAKRAADTSEHMLELERHRDLEANEHAIKIKLEKLLLLQDEGAAQGIANLCHRYGRDEIMDLYVQVYEERQHGSQADIKSHVTAMLARVNRRMCIDSFEVVADE